MIDKRWWCWVLLGVLVLTGCRSAAPLPGSPPEVDVALSEYRIDYEGPIPAGRVVFRVQNEGTREHELVLVALPEDFPPVEEQLRSPEAQAVETLAVLPRRPADRTGTFAVDFTPGRYAMICFVTDDDGKTHGSKGMAREFRVL